MRSSDLTVKERIWGKLVFALVAIILGMLLIFFNSRRINAPVQGAGELEKITIINTPWEVLPNGAFRIEYGFDRHLGMKIQVKNPDGIESYHFNEWCDVPAGGMLVLSAIHARENDIGPYLSLVGRYMNHQESVRLTDCPDGTVTFVGNYWLGVWEDDFLAVQREKARVRVELGLPKK